MSVVINIFQEPEASAFQPAPPLLTPPLPDSGLYLPEPLLPDLIPKVQRTSQHSLPFSLPSPNNPHLGRERIIVEMEQNGLMIR